MFAVRMLCVFFALIGVGGCAKQEAQQLPPEMPSERQENAGAPDAEVGIPQGVFAISTKPDLIRIRWGKVEGAKGYEVYKATDKDGEYSLIATELDSSEKIIMAVLDTDVKAGQDHYYKVRAFIEPNDEKIYSGYSEEVVCRPKPTSNVIPAENTEEPDKSKPEAQSPLGENSAETGGSSGGISSGADGSAGDGGNTGVSPTGGKTWHEAVYDKVWVVDVPASTREEPVYETVERFECNCGAIYYSEPEIWAHADQHLINNEPDAYKPMSEKRQVGTNIINVPEQGHWEDVLVREAGYY